MPGSQSTIDRLRDPVARAAAMRDVIYLEPRQRRPLWLGLLVGLVCGLMLGLLIGWRLWPVTWTNASVTELAPAGRAEYVAAVADAYVAARSQQARAVAQRRLQALGDADAQAAALVAAQDWFRQNRVDEEAVRSTNLNELASALGLLAVNAAGQPVPAVSVPVGEAAPSQPLIDITPVTDIGQPVSTGLSWFWWLSTVLVSLLLIGLGLAVLRRLYFGQPSGSVAGAEGGSGWLDRQVGTSTGQTARADEPYADISVELEEHARVVAAQRQPGGAGRPTAGTTAAVHDEYSFDEEPDYLPNAGTVTIDVTAADHDLPDDDVVEDDEFDDDWEDEVVPEPATSVVAAVPSPAEPRTALAPLSLRGREIERKSLRYQAGDPDFEEAHNIRDLDSGQYIGEYGLGVNIKNGILQNNPENVVALDVWLFDKTNDRQLETKTQVLISEHISDSNLEKVFTGNEHEPAPLVARPGAQFQLEGAHLLLECTIGRVDYGSVDGVDGVFRNLELAIVVSRKR